MKERYLDPKADLVFKKVFGEHPDLVMSLLNALLPLPEGEEVEEVEYLSAELVPETPLRKNSIVDVRCKDRKGRQFIVEMQMVWSSEFKQRVLFNASKAYVRQLDKREHYHLLQPVYSLNLVNEIFETGTPDYYHYYRLVHDKHTEKVIDGLHLVFVELPKFVPHSLSEKKMQCLWLRYMTEIGECGAQEIPAELLENPLLNKAVSIVRESAYDDEQLMAYDSFWDAIRVEKALMDGSERKGLERGRAEGRAEGLLEGRAEGLLEGEAIGRAEQNIANAKNLKALGVTVDIIMKATGLSAEEIEKL